MNNDYLIAWQKWFDPFGEDEDDSTDFNYEDEEIEDSDVTFAPKQFKAISTPMGIIPYTENTASSKIFNFWLGHTNFDITNKIASIIGECLGVESLDVFTRYRFRIAIGKAFDESEVKKNITETIYGYLNNDPIRQ